MGAGAACTASSIWGAKGYWCSKNAANPVPSRPVHGHFVDKSSIGGGRPREPGPSGGQTRSIGSRHAFGGLLSRIGRAYGHEEESDGFGPDRALLATERAPRRECELSPGLPRVPPHGPRARTTVRALVSVPSSSRAAAKRAPDTRSPVRSCAYTWAWRAVPCDRLLPRRGGRRGGGRAGSGGGGACEAALWRPSARGMDNAASAAVGETARSSSRPRTPAAVRWSGQASSAGAGPSPVSPRFRASRQVSIRSRVPSFL
ncbi:hypothetical protein SUDANB19_00439 [Streptomyces sp. enrichment culture]